MDSNSIVKTISTPQYFFDVLPTDRFDALCRILDMYMNKSVVVFCRTKKDVDHMSDKLRLLNYNVESYHGDLSSNSKERVIKRFAEGDIDICLVTEIPNNIESIKALDLVLFSVIPQDPEAYIQRIIRFESCLNLGEVATIVTSTEFKKLALIKRITKTDVIQRQFLDVNDIIQLKMSQLKQELQQFNDQNDRDALLMDCIKEVGATIDLETIVYFLIKHKLKRDFDASAYKPLQQLEKISKTDISDGERLFIALGKADGINDNTLADYLYKETNIEQSHFSEFKIFETFSFFVVPSEDAEVVLELFRRKKRGKRSIVERAKGKDAKK